jgi:Rod binding domain-containing protein
VRQNQADFASVMSRRAEASVKGDPGAAREAAADFVSAAFIEPLLKEARAANRAAPPFAPGPAEKQFQGLMDAQLARRIARSGNFPLVDRLTSDLMRKPRATAEAGTALPAAPAVKPALPVIGGGA